MFSLYGASRDNDRCCARLGDDEVSQLVPSKGTSQKGYMWTGQLNLEFNYAISVRCFRLYGRKLATWTSTHEILRYTRGDVSLE